MSRNLGPTCKIARRLGRDLHLKSGIRPLDSKCKLSVPPGMHGAKRTRKSDYAIMMNEKQAVRLTYRITEKQFRRYYERAAKKRGVTSDNLLNFLESRLDNVVFRMGFACTRAESRQLVNHGAVLVNGKRVNIPSYQVKENDVIEIAERSKGQGRIQAAIKDRIPVDWVEFDLQKLQGILKSLPSLPTEFNVNLVVAYYSK